MFEACKCTFSLNHLIHVQFNDIFMLHTYIVIHNLYIDTLTFVIEELDINSFIVVSA